jgi:hypothetical protein
MVVLDVDRVLEIVPETISKTLSKTTLAA